MKVKILLILSLFLCSCKQLQQYHEHSEYDSTVQIRMLRDSIIVAQRDSVFLYRSPDSVYKEVWRIRYRDRDRLKVDTVFVEKIRTDTMIVRDCTSYKKNSRRGFSAFAVTLAVIAVLLLALLMYRRNG